MPNLKLYNADFSPNALRVRAVAYELGLDIEIIEVKVFEGENKTDAFLALNPNAKIPVLTDGDFTLWESRAINAYLASLAPEHGLNPEDAKQRAHIEQWSYWQAIHLGPAMQKLTMERVFKQKFKMGDPDEDIIKTQLKDIAQFMPVLDQSLSGKDWVVGNLSIADFAMASTFMHRVVADISLADTPNVASWIERLEALSSWQKAVAPMLAMAK